MLGLADKSKLISLLIEIFQGKEKEAHLHLNKLINDGLDAKNFLNDILEILYLFSRRLNLGSIEKDVYISESDSKLDEQNAKSIDMQDIALFWQLTIKTIDDLKLVGNENLVLEMYVTQLIHLNSLNQNEANYNEPAISRNNQENFSERKIDNKDLETNTSNQTKNQLKSTNQIKSNPVKNFSAQNIEKKIEIKSFQDLINYANLEKEIELKYDLERNVKLVSFSRGTINISFNEKLNKNFIKNLLDKLLQWTGERWIITLSKNTEAKSIYEKIRR